MSVESKPPRILYVSPYWPSEVTGGAEWRSAQVLRALQQIGEVDFVYLRYDTWEADTSVPLDGKLRLAGVLEVTQQMEESFSGKVRRVSNPRSLYQYGWRVVNQQQANSIFRAANEFDLVWFFKLRSADVFPNRTWPHSLVDIDDVPSTYESAMLNRAGGLRQSIVTSLRIMNWRRRERLLGERFSGLAVCSECDRSYLGRVGVRAPIHVIPNGFDPPVKPVARKPVTPPTLGFVGYLNYLPNVEGVRWFVKQCWPLIKREVPEARLRVAGRDPNGALKLVGGDVDTLGWVEDLDAEIATWSAMIVPILAGGGTRVKIALGLSRKCPVVSTSLGAYGYGLKDGQELFLADSPAAFAAACVRTMQRPGEAAEMAERAWQQFLQQWSWEAIRPQIWAAAEACLRRSGWRSAELVANCA